MFCPNCGAQVAADDKFCRSCGKALTGANGESLTTLSSSDRTDDSTTSKVDDDAALYGYGDSNRELPTLTKPRANPWQVERTRVKSEPDDSWSMSDLGPPPARPRRTWLWVIMGLLAAMVIACCAFMSWVSFTDSGQEWFEEKATEISVTATNAADSGDATETPIASPTAD